MKQFIAIAAIIIGATGSAKADDQVCRSTYIENSDSDLRFDLGFCLAAKFDTTYSCKFDSENTITLCRTDSDYIDFGISWNGPTGSIIRLDNKAKIGTIEATGEKRILWRDGAVDTCNVMRTGEVRWCESKAQPEPVVEAPKPKPVVEPQYSYQMKLTQALGDTNMPNSEVRIIALNGKDPVMACYREAASKDHSLNGSVKIKFIVENGRTSAFSDNEDDGNIGAYVGRCIANVVDKWVFSGDGIGMYIWQFSNAKQESI